MAVMQLLLPYCGAIVYAILLSNCSCAIISKIILVYSRFCRDPGSTVYTTEKYNKKGVDRKIDWHLTFFLIWTCMFVDELA